jgi:trichodiene synthase
MDQSGFPTSDYCSSIVRLLHAVEYHDTNWDRQDRIEALRTIHAGTVAHFSRPLPQRALEGVNPQRLLTLTRVMPELVVSAWSRVPVNILTDINTFLTVIAILDDHPISLESDVLSTFWTDLLQGKEQKHRMWVLFNDCLPNLLRHYDPFSAWNIMRSTFDFFQGCWIEESSFQGYPGAGSFPGFLRRMNGLGGVVAGTLFPACDFNQKELFQELTCVTAHMDGVVTLVNDLLSYYKEFDKDEANLVSNWCVTDGIDQQQALQRLTEQSIHACKQLLGVVAGRDPKVGETIRCYIHGYISSHFCSERYRLSEVYEKATGPDVEAFRGFYEKGMDAAMVSPAQWTLPMEQLRSKLVSKPVGVDSGDDAFVKAAMPDLLKQTS